MNINFNNQSYRVRFAYTDGKNTGRKALQKIHNRRIVTSATVQTKQGEEWIDLATGESIRNKHDIFDKALGRRMALGNATKQLGNKPLQRAIWDVYFDQHRDGTTLMISSEHTATR
jgi:hypothetical protein